MISIIVPTLNEESELPGLLDHLRALNGESEIIIVDGGSSDPTPKIARGADHARLIESPRGRGVQIHQGAQQAAGEIFLVLHADARLPDQALQKISRAVADGASWGWFNISYDADTVGLRLIQGYLNIHAHLLGEPTGENAMWATREAWEQAGGCPRIPLMEDLELARRLRRSGRGVALNDPVMCSTRRYEAWTTPGMSVRCILMWLLFHAGAAPETLKKLYPQVR